VWVVCVMVLAVVVELVVAQPLLQVTGHDSEGEAQYCFFSPAFSGNARNKQPSEGASKSVLSCTNCLNPSLSSTQLEDGDGVGVDVLSAVVVGDGVGVRAVVVGDGVGFGVGAVVVGDGVGAVVVGDGVGFGVASVVVGDGVGFGVASVVVGDGVGNGVGAVVVEDGVGFGVVELVVAQPLLQVTGHNSEVAAQYCFFSPAFSGNARNKQPSEGASKSVLSCTNCLNPSLSSTQLEDGDGVGVDVLGDTV